MLDPETPPLASARPGRNANALGVVWKRVGPRHTACREWHVAGFAART
jgi:hypothetical protein